MKRPEFRGGSNTAESSEEVPEFIARGAYVCRADSRGAALESATLSHGGCTRLAPGSSQSTSKKSGGRCRKDRAQDHFLCLAHLLGTFRGSELFCRPGRSTLDCGVLQHLIGNQGGLWAEMSLQLIPTHLHRRGMRCPAVEKIHLTLRVSDGRQPTNHLTR